MYVVVRKLRQRPLAVITSVHADFDSALVGMRKNRGVDPGTIPHTPDKECRRSAGISHGKCSSYHAHCSVDDGHLTYVPKALASKRSRRRCRTALERPLPMGKRTSHRLSAPDLALLCSTSDAAMQLLSLQVFVIMACCELLSNRQPEHDLGRFQSIRERFRRAEHTSSTARGRLEGATVCPYHDTANRPTRDPRIDLRRLH